jgi:sialidase-1
MPFSIQLILLTFFFQLELTAQTAPPLYLFKNHTDGYGMYRIPTIIRAKSGKLLAFCEGRQSLFDHGNIDLVMKTSADNGVTWSRLAVVWNEGTNTCGNPSPVIDETTGDVIVLVTLNNDKVFVLRSKSEGESWEVPVDITKDVKETDWHWYATGPVHAIQVKHKPYRGRIVVPCNHTIEGDPVHYSHVIFSDDSGKTWKKSGSVSSKDTDESTVVELSDSNLMLNMRNSDRAFPCRKVSKSIDGGNTWSVTTFDTTLIEPVCQGALLRYEDVILFSNPSHKSQRKNLTIHVSKDDGKSWQKIFTVHKGKSAYSDLVSLDNGTILCLYETGKILPYSGIVYKVLPIVYTKP